MRKLHSVMVLFLVFVLSSCAANADLNNFESRQDGTLFSSDGQVIVEYKTDKDGKMIELNIDRLLTIEQMVLLNPNIDFSIVVPGSSGAIFISPSDRCTEYSDDVLLPMNIEVGNTRYKYDNTVCMYKTVDNDNRFKPGFAEEYHVQDTIQEKRNVEISIIVYTPNELVTFTEIYDLPHTYETLGVYNVMFNEERDDFYDSYSNYYLDTAIYEQLYLKHQENEGAVNEMLGVSTELNLLDLDSVLDVNPLIENFDSTYAIEILAMGELQDKIGVGFESEEEPTDEENPEEGDTT